MATARAPVPALPVAVASAGAPSMSTQATAAPSAARRWATARPMPEPAPVTNAVLPSKRGSITVPRSVHRWFGQHAPEPHEADGGAAQVQLELLGGKEVAVQRVVAVDAHPAVDVLRRVHHPLTTLGRPVLRGRHLLRRRQADVEPPRR